MVWNFAFGVYKFGHTLMKIYKLNDFQLYVFISVSVTMENVTKLIKVLQKIESFIEACDIPQLKNNINFQLTSPFHHESYLEINTHGLNRVQKRLLSEAVYKFYQLEQPFFSYSFLLTRTIKFIVLTSSSNNGLTKIDCVSSI